MLCYTRFVVAFSVVMVLMHCVILCAYRSFLCNRYFDEHTVFEWPRVGLIDPWHSLGVLVNITSDELAIVIPGASHCEDMFNDDPDDLPALRGARQASPRAGIGLFISICPSAEVKICFGKK